MKLQFSTIIPFDKIPDGHDIDSGSFEYTGGLEKGGIYMAFSITEFNNEIIIGKLLYIGKAESPSNCLGKRINEHGQPQTGQITSDHARWRKNTKLSALHKIGYCYAPLDDMTHIKDIENKLIWINQPECNTLGKESDCSSPDLDSIELSIPFDAPVKGYDPSIFDLAAGASK